MQSSISFCPFHIAMLSVMSNVFHCFTLSWELHYPTLTIWKRRQIRTLNNLVFCILSDHFLPLPTLIASFSFRRVQFHHESWNREHRPYVIIYYIIIILFIEVLRNALWLYDSRTSSSALYSCTQKVSS